MSKFITCFSALLIAVSAGVGVAYAHPTDRTLAVVMTNDLNANQIKVYDATTRVLLQTLSTQGRGGVGGNARGLKQYEGDIVATVNNGSNSVAVFRRDGSRLRYVGSVTTTSAPVSIDFGNGHMYVAGATSVDSFVMHGHRVEWMDGTTALELAEGGTPTTGGGPSDIDAANGVLGTIDHAAGQSHLSLFAYNRFGELATRGVPINLGVANANGVAIKPPAERNDD